MINIAICFLFSIIIFVTTVQEILLCPLKKKKGNEIQRSELKTTASAEPTVETGCLCRQNLQVAPKYDSEIIILRDDNKKSVCMKGFKKPAFKKQTT